VRNDAYLLLLLVGLLIALADGQVIARNASACLHGAYEDPRHERQAVGLVVALFHLTMLGLVCLVTSQWLYPSLAVKSLVPRIGVLLLLAALCHGVTVIVLSRLRIEQAGVERAEAQLREQREQDDRERRDEDAREVPHPDAAAT
jgi:hypothetical protein